MADYRQIHTHIWKDGWFLDLGTDEKLLFIYLFSNERASIAGIFELAPKVMCFETGLPSKAVSTALRKFGTDGKVHYADGVVWVVNLRRYNESASPKVKVRIAKDLDAIPDCELKTRYLDHYSHKNNGIHSVSVPYPELVSEQEQEQEQEQELTHAANAASVPDPVKELAGVFEQAAGIKLPTPSGEKARKQVGVIWWNPLREMQTLANGRAGDLLRQAVKQMRRDGLTIQAPISVKAVFTSLHGETVAGSPTPKIRYLND